MKKVVLGIVASFICLTALAQPKVVGHRGCRYEGPFENTLASLKIAQGVGVDAVEFDVNLTSDEEVIVFHGPKVPGTDRDVRDMTFAEARKVVLPGGHRMPTLEEWFRQGKKHPEIKLIIEIKAQRSREKETLLISKTIEAVRKAKIQSQVEYTAFGSFMCKEIHRLDPAAKVIYLQSGVEAHDAAWAKEMGFNGISFDLNAFLNRPQIVTQARELGIETTLWLVNDYEVADWAILHGINYISTDFPEKLVPYIEAVKAYRKAVQ